MIPFAPGETKQVDVGLVPVPFAQSATLADFQANPATGDFRSGLIHRLNDGDTSGATGGLVGQYAEVDFGKVVAINQWRQRGGNTQWGNGEWKIQVWDLDAEVWVDWVTGIPTLQTYDWSEMSVEAEVVTDKIRLVCVIVDGVGMSVLRELEVYHTAEL